MLLDQAVFGWPGWQLDITYWLQKRFWASIPECTVCIVAVHNELDVRPGTVGSSEDRKFPSLEMVALVGRRPKFYVLNAAMPVFFFVPMALLQFSVVREQTDGRLSVSLAIVLTADHLFSR